MIKALGMLLIAYTPELDVASCGPTEAKARKNLHEAVEIVLEEVERFTFKQNL